MTRREFITMIWKPKDPSHKGWLNYTFEEDRPDKLYPFACPEQPDNQCCCTSDTGGCTRFGGVYDEKDRILICEYKEEVVCI